jgi:3-oxoacyl-[acyl-carrier-protein] synthase III
MEAVVRAIAYHLPEHVLSNEQLAREFPDFSSAKIEAKTGICERRLAAPDECASDLAAVAAERLFATGLSPRDVDFLLFCTQSPDYPLPSTACLLQQRLGIPTTAGALDFNLGCSGYVYGLSLAKGLIESGQVCNVLLLTGETYSKYLAPRDRGVRTIFGDGGAATWITAAPVADLAMPAIGPVIFGTDGAGECNLIVRKGGARHCGTSERDAHLYMNGGEIFTFTLRTVPSAVAQLLERAGLTLGEVDRFVFHQANQYMLEHLRQKLGIAAEKFIIEMRDCGNTVSSTIPIALKRALDAGTIRPGHRVMLVGFGVGYSWGALLLRVSEPPA